MSLNFESDINIAGMINAERKSAPKILLPVKEGLHNSLEIIRLARNKDPSVKGCIYIIFIIVDGIFSKWSIVDNATGGTGIKNIDTKKIYKLYDHSGDKTGFSEYGIGSKIENLRCCDIVEHHTITDSQLYESTKWNIARSIEENSLLDIIEYTREPQYKPLLKYMKHGYKTGTMLLCSEILPRLKNKDTKNYITNIEESNSLYAELSNHLIVYDKDNIDINYIVYEDDLNVPKINEQILPRNILASKGVKTFEIICCEDKKNRDMQSYVINGPNFDNYVSFEDAILTPLNYNLDKRTNIISYYDGQKIDKLNSSKIKYTGTISDIEKKCNITSVVKLILSTEPLVYDDDGNIKNDDKKGFYGAREVSGGNIVCTTIDPIKLKWKTIDSHKTRFTQLRGVIQYDRKSDQVLLSDKSKSLSDDRDIEPTLRFNILKLTHDYFSEMRKHYGDYETDSKKKPQPEEIKEEKEPAHVEFTEVTEEELQEEKEEVKEALKEEEKEEEKEEVKEEVKEDDEEEEEIPVEFTDVDEVVTVVKEEEKEEVTFTSFTTGQHERKIVTVDEAIKALKIIYSYYQKGNLITEIEELFTKISCHLIGKGGDENAIMFINAVPVNKQLEIIKKIWNQENSVYSSVKMGSEVVKFVINNNL